ncbi:MAG: protein-L-isoaspartate(D-aspartate) O-methyltransferase [Streptosporangiales bacterium]|nr:protein-L-isoaspartate(D-aspartate) O-methyltransferase [Streptosporangiales bacterium]
MGKPSRFEGGASPSTLVHTVEAAGVTDRRVLDAVRSTPREGFVPAEYASLAYVDAPIPIGSDQVTSQPSLIAQMVAAARPGEDERVLEVGTGFGFQTALLARLARHVWSIERHADLADEARDNLAAAGVDNVTVLVGDGTQGLPEHAPYQGIVVSAAAPSVPDPLADQLAEGGRLVQPVGAGGDERVTLFGKRRGRLVELGMVSPASFVPLIGGRR